LSGGLSGCPDDDDCTEPEQPVELAPAEADPNLTTFEGTFTWLQTGDEAKLRFSTSRVASLGTKTCGQIAMEVEQELETTDGLVSVEGVSQQAATDDGFLIVRTQWFTLDPRPWIEAGRVPDAPGILARNPTAVATLAPEADGTWTAMFVVETSSDHMTVGSATLSRLTGP
jgi:hypothetical protein